MIDDTCRDRKVRSLGELATEMAGFRARGQTIVLCHGCFDILHIGHYRHLRAARVYGDKLVVSVTADEHVGKGLGRPVFPLELRMELVAALAIVDFVVPSFAPDSRAILATLLPDIYCKGAEYERSPMDERLASEVAALQSYGGRLVFTHDPVVSSSTQLLARDVRIPRGAISSPHGWSDE